MLCCHNSSKKIICRVEPDLSRTKWNATYLYKIHVEGQINQRTSTVALVLCKYMYFWIFLPLHFLRGSTCCSRLARLENKMSVNSPNYSLILTDYFESHKHKNLWEETKLQNVSHLTLVQVMCLKTPLCFKTAFSSLLNLYFLQYKARP